MSFKNKLVSPYSVSAPQSLDELKARLESLTGKTLLELADKALVPLPRNTTSGKGFTGELLEILLGASAGNLPVPDFPQLKLELKTLPVDENLKPLESTFICHAPLINKRGQRFEDSTLFCKISSILFVFVLAPRDLPFAERKIMGFHFFKPSSEELALIKEDWEELMEMVSLGQVQQITARYGTVIQMRPKAADGSQLTDCIGPDGTMIKTRPRGFYMRRAFTQKLIDKIKKNKI